MGSLHACIPVAVVLTQSHTLLIVAIRIPHPFPLGAIPCSPVAETMHDTGGDQGLLNAFFNTYSTTPHPSSSPFVGRTARLPFVYNTTPSASYSYLPAYEHFKQHIKVVHFIGEGKPWKYDRSTDGSVIPRYVRTLCYESEFVFAALGTVGAMSSLASFK